MAPPSEYVKRMNEKRRGAVGVNTVEGGEDAIEVTDDEERSRQRGQKREEGLGEELCAAC